jgi:Fur family ferric uptake transcriptional regulator
MRTILSLMPSYTSLMPVREQLDLTELLLAKGLRPTRQRVEVLSELAREPDDATAQQLWARLRERSDSTIGLATVYRTLARLRDEGLVDALSHHSSEQCFRLCTDAHHHHLFCVNCHKVVELDDCSLGSWVDDMAGRHGFVAEEHSVEISGRCADCASSL